MVNVTKNKHIKYLYLHDKYNLFALSAIFYKQSLNQTIILQKHLHTKLTKNGMMNITTKLKPKNSFHAIGW